MKVAELFAGIGGFRVGMEDLGYDFVYADQWEPNYKRQFAHECYESHFGKGSCDNRPIQDVVANIDDVPDVDMIVMGLPCEDYSIAAKLNTIDGIKGKRGVLWWYAFDFIREQVSRSDDNARYVLIENVDRLLRSPAEQRGRDFAIMLSCLASLGYTVEWEVVNSEDFGFPTRRKRIYVLATRKIPSIGCIHTAFPYDTDAEDRFDVPKDLSEIMKSFGGKVSPFKDTGYMSDWQVVTAKPISAIYSGKRETLGDCLQPEADVPAEYYLDKEAYDRFVYYKGEKHVPRVNKQGKEWVYREGAMAFPDSLDKPSRTITTLELVGKANRTSHVVYVDGKYRRLTPVELERLHGFPDNWTRDLTKTQRGFVIGNSLVTGIPRRIGNEILYSEMNFA